MITFKTMAYTPSEGNVSAYIGPFAFRTNFEGSNTGAKGPAVQTGVGLVALGDINRKGSLEIGLILMEKIYFREDQGQYMAEQTRVTHIAMGYRRWFHQYFSGSLTFYSAYSMGDVRVIHSDFAPGTEIPTSARDVTEYGFDFALQTELWSTENYTVVADARYSKSVTSKAGEDGDHYGLLIGVQYQLQEKKPDDNLLRKK
jgi:hypothetical protein